MTALLHLLLSHALSIVGLAMGAVLIAHVLLQRRAPQSTVAWLLAIVLIPYVGVPLYIVFGGRKLRRDAALKTPLYEADQTDALPTIDAGIAGMLTASGAPPPRDGNDVALLATGEEAYRAIVDLIGQARRSLHISTLILADDEVGAELVARLEEKARQGVEVRLLIDALFRFRAPRRLLASLRDAGGRTAWFMPVWHMPFRGHANLRLHRKVLLADDATAIVGGMNLAREYMGPVPLSGRWVDLAARIDGPAVADLADVFRADWRFASAETLATHPRPVARGASAAEVVASGPDAPSDLLYDAFLSMVFAARRRLWIATPYFVPDEALTRSLGIAARRGVDVRVLVPGRSNHLSADLAGASYLRQLAESGATIARYRKGMLHAKLVLADDSLAVLGSANLDMRSLFLDYEIALFLSHRQEIDALSRWYESVLADCDPLRTPGRGRTLVEGVARLFGPLA
jgi:cardiolipin synthase A/B